MNRLKSAPWGSLLVAALALNACATLPRHRPSGTPAADGRPPVVVYVIRRSWHTDVGFGSGDLRPPLAGLRQQLPGAQSILFGFGDRHYLLAHDHRTGDLLGALLPGPGVVLVTGLPGTPESAFGTDQVRRLTLTAGQAQSLEDFVWASLAAPGRGAQELGPGPYAGSLYYASTVRYSGLHTCNTWTAQALQAAGLPIHSWLVEFAGQVWRQLKEISAP